MNWKGLVNYVLSVGASFLVGFFSVPMLVENVSLKVQLSAGVTAGVASAIAHVRENPFKL